MDHAEVVSALVVHVEDHVVKSEDSPVDRASQTRTRAAEVPNTLRASIDWSSEVSYFFVRILSPGEEAVSDEDVEDFGGPINERTFET